MHKLPVGKLRVGAPDAFAERYIVPGLGGFLAAYPTASTRSIRPTARWRRAFASWSTTSCATSAPADCRAEELDLN